ncbi:MAG TPA: YncE family protein [Vicinamibacterales bacterium]|nr:YncE family protein [Vicinamibacterales bacterium]
MVRKSVAVVAALLCLSGGVSAQGAAPLKLAQRFRLPATVKGSLDHLSVDVGGKRLFVAAEDDHAVLVLDLETGALVHTIGGIGRPHAILFRPGLNGIYVTDGAKGDLKIYDGKTYRPVLSTKLGPDTDAIGYDPATKYLYVDSDGSDPHKKYSLLNMVDTSSGYKGTDMHLDGDGLRAMALEKAGPRIYVDNEAKNEVDVIDRENWTLVGRWPVTMGQHNTAIALDEGGHRLFVGCRSGEVVVFDTETGKEIKALPIGAGVDDLAFDAMNNRLYAVSGGGGGSISVYQEKGGDQFESLGRVVSGPGAKTGCLVTALRKFFVSVPAHGSDPAEVLVYDLQ